MPLKCCKNVLSKRNTINFVVYYMNNNIYLKALKILTMKQLSIFKEKILLILFLISNLSLAQDVSKDILHFNTQLPIECEYTFQSLSFETIEEIQKVKLTKSVFIHLVTDINNHFFLSDISNMTISQKNKFYQNLHDIGFSFQIDHGLPDGYIWVIALKDKSTPKDYLQLISNLLLQSYK